MKFLIIQENGRHEVSKHLRECNSMQRALQFHNQECDVWGLGHDNFAIIPDYHAYDVIIILKIMIPVGCLIYLMLLSH